MGKRFLWPEVDELVMCSVKKVKNYGAFVSLDEYRDKEGFIHIAEIASGWVKYIGNHIREGTKIVAKVIRVNSRKEQIDLSLKRVNSHQKRAKTQEWRRNRKMLKLFELMADRLGKDVDDCYEEFGYDLMETFGSLYNAFEAVAINRNVLEEEEFEGDWMETMVETAEANMTPPYVELAEKILLFSPAPNGVEHIKEVVKQVTEEEETDLNLKYVGAPEYRITITATDYKTAENRLSDISEKIISLIKKKGGYGLFAR